MSKNLTDSSGDTLGYATSTAKALFDANGIFQGYQLGDGGSANVRVPETQRGMISVFWSGVGTTSAPDPELYSVGAIGANLDGISTGSVYHVVGAVGSKAWVDTGALVTNLYGG